MKLTLSVIKADVGSIGGHTKPSERMMEAVRSDVRQAKSKGLIIDGFVSHTGDDIAILMSHTRGPDDTDVHQFAWDSFIGATGIAQDAGLYGAGQDLLVDAPSSNVRGAGPAVAELEFEHDPVKTNKVRPAESFCVFAADKCGPGAYNLPIFLAFADPMYCAGLMLPKMIQGFRFRIIDMDNVGGDSIIELNAPEDYYKIAILLRDNERFAIESIYSRTFDEPAVAISAQRLHNIAGTYTGKDDPVAIVRNQGVFPAPEEILSPFGKAHFVGGDARRLPRHAPHARRHKHCRHRHLLPPPRLLHGLLHRLRRPLLRVHHRHVRQRRLGLSPVPCPGEGHAEMRSQGWSGAAMLPYTELEYSGFRTVVEDLVGRFAIQNGQKSAEEAAATMKSVG